MASAKTKVCPGRAGDLIVFQRATHKHYAVNVGNGEIVHLTSAGGLNNFNVVLGITVHSCSGSRNPSIQGISVVKKEEYNAFHQEGDVVYVEKHGRLPVREIVRRAKSRVNEEGYDLLCGNCEHFARWCCCGEWKSTQADTLMLRIFIFAAFMWVILFIILVKMLMS